MDINTAFSFLIIAGQIGTFFFCNQQLKSKNRVIEDLQTLMDTTDIKRLAEYYKSTDAIRAKRLLEETAFELPTWKLEQHADWGYKFDEVTSFAASLLKVMPKETREMIINRDMPIAGNCLLNFLKKLKAKKAPILIIILSLN